MEERDGGEDRVCGNERHVCRWFVCEMNVNVFRARYVAFMTEMDSRVSPDHE